MSRVVLYGRPGCHLCDDARDALERLGVAFSERDIEGDDVLLRRHLERIPVLEVDGEEVLEAPFGEHELREVFGTLHPG
ncbi:MAG TPA: glutaredoxin family protein [Solirubrobacteraceae bacterium]|nr:glutaredoxin family protein [Solirubrobacteraceae bacterium]